MKSGRFTIFVLILSLFLIPACQGQKIHLTPGPKVTPRGDAQNVQLIGQYGSFVTTVTFREDYAYIGGLVRLLVWDVSDLSQPVFVNRLDIIMRDDIESVTIMDNTAYLAFGRAGLVIVDVSNNRLVKVGLYDTPGNAMGVAVKGSYAYVADDKGRLRILDISDSAHPAEVGFYNTPGNAQDVVVTAGYVYVVGKAISLRVLDISDPVYPVEVGFLDTPGGAESVAVAGNYVYIASGEGGLRIVDISNPTRPVEVGFFDTPGNAQDVAIEGNYAYIADGHSLLVVDISNPTKPSQAGFYEGTVMTVAVMGNIAYTTGMHAGLSILQFVPPDTTSTPGGS